MLKFENTAEIGDRIRAYDFQPMPGRPDSFVEGTIIDKGWNPYNTYKCYTIICDEDSTGSGRIGDDIYIPFGTLIMDWDNRIVKLP